MKPVNLLPASERPKQVAAVPEATSKAVIAGLAVLLLAMGAFVFTKNQVTDERAATAEAEQERAAADARAQSLGAFANFRQIKQARQQSVTDLASKRFDWERFMRELALVLPDRVFLTTVNAGAATTDSGSGTAPANPSAGSVAPEAKLEGCAPSQKAVAETMVRLRQLYSASDVVLQDSTGAAKETAAGASATSGNASEGSNKCAKGFKFNATVTFTASAAKGAAKPKPIPSRLGGGA